jgi:hypothetical protein
MGQNFIYSIFHPRLQRQLLQEHAEGGAKNQADSVAGILT